MSGIAVRAWIKVRPWLCVTLALSACLLRGSQFIENMQLWPWSDGGRLPDFYQEWSSARNYFEGLPIYLGFESSVPRHLHYTPKMESATVVVNAHPPTSVLLALPFGQLDLYGAFFAWNLVSLVLLAFSLLLTQRQMKHSFSAWLVFPLAAFLMYFSPLWDNFHRGQLSLVLLLLLRGIWAAERSGRARLAGLLLATATAIKLFPGFLFIHFAMQRRWRTVTSGLAMLFGLTMLTGAVVGFAPYQTYVRDVLPRLLVFRFARFNASVWSFWSKAFDRAPRGNPFYGATEPLWYNPALATAGIWLTTAIVIGTLAWASRRATTPCQRDLAFGLAVTAMLILSPITWEHSLILLLVPATVFWRALPRRNLAGAAFVLVLLSFLFTPTFVYTTLGLGKTGIKPPISLTALSFRLYGLLALFALGVMALNASKRRIEGKDSAMQSG